MILLAIVTLIGFGLIGHLLISTVIEMLQDWRQNG